MAAFALSDVLAKLATSRLGRALAPVASILILFGMRDRSNSFVLNIGDEGSTAVQLRAGQVVDAIFVEATAEDGWDALRDLLATEPAAQIVLVADVLEQMFREDTVPKVGLFDRGKIVRRRLDLTFPNDVLKAALPLERKKGAPQAVLFTALPMSERLAAWVEFLDQFPNPVRGFYMLPLEAVGVAERLAPPAEGESRRVWRALITQEAASGFRQVFESGGKLVVTRLTQRPAQPLAPEAEAMLIERELRSSISYVKRLGFSDSDRLDVVVLADPAVCRAVDERDLPATTVTLYTPYQAGIVLELGETGREDSPFADVLLGLWVERKRKKTAILPTPKIWQQLRVETLTRWSAVATVALTLVAAFYLVSLVSDLISNSSDIAELNARKAALDGALSVERDRAGGSAIPLDVLAQVGENEERLSQGEVDVDGLMRKLSGALGPDIRATDVEFDIPNAKPTPNVRANPGKAVAANPTAATPYDLHVIVTFGSNDSGTAVQVASESAKALKERLVAAFPGHEVQAVKLPSDQMVNQTIEGTGGGLANSAAPGNTKEITAEFTIRKLG